MTTERLKWATEEYQAALANWKASRDATRKAEKAQEAADDRLRLARNALNFETECVAKDKIANA